MASPLVVGSLILWIVIFGGIYKVQQIDDEVQTKQETGGGEYNFTVVEMKRTVHPRAFADSQNDKDNNGIHDETTTRDYLLNVPFYVYEDLVWLENATLESETIRTHFGKPVINDWSDMMKFISFKHSTDIHFCRAALEHPMRTRNPAEARLFVVPTFWNLIVFSKAYKDLKFCWRGMCNQQLLEYDDLLDLFLKVDHPK